MEKFFFPEPLNTRVLAMQPLIKPEPVVPPQPPMVSPAPWPMISQPWQSMPPFLLNQPPPMYSDLFYNNPSFFPSAANYGMETSFNAPITQATLSNHFQQMIDNPLLLSSQNNQVIPNYSPGDLVNQRHTPPDDQLNEMIRLQLLQQQRLNYNHERLLERYGRLRAPRVSEYRSFGASALPGRNYNQYLEELQGDDEYNRLGNSLAAQSRARIGISDETYRWMGDEDSQALPRDVNSMFQNSRNDSRSVVRGEKIESRKISDYFTFERISTAIRSFLTEERQTNNAQSITRISSDYPSNPPENTSRNLFDINDDIQRYGQSLHIPSNFTDYVNMSFVFNSESIPSSKSHELSSSLEHRSDRKARLPTVDVWTV